MERVLCKVLPKPALYALRRIRLTVKGGSAFRGSSLESSIAPAIFEPLSRRLVRLFPASPPIRPTVADQSRPSMASHHSFCATSTSFSLCDTPMLVESAVSSLRNATHFVVDCEGIDLGQQAGRLTLLSVLALPNTQDSASVSYHFDVLSLDKEALSPIFALLSSSSYTKIMFDGRMDYAALFHEHGVELQNVLDLQLAEASSRNISEAENQRKVMRYLGQSTSSAVNYAKLRTVAGLGMCIRVYGASSEPEGGKGDFNHSMWLERPLPPQYLEYAAKDVVLISKLYHAFVRRGFITSALPAQSQRYISLFKGGKPLPERSSFKQNAFLPLDILDYNPNSPSKMCVGCERNMSVECFQGEAKYCFVCAAMLVKMNA